MTRLLNILLLSCALAPVAAFAPGHAGAIGNARDTSELSMGFLDGIFGGGDAPAPTAEASHILVKGPFASQRLEKIKTEIYMNAIGGGDPSKGVQREKLMDAFAQQAKKNSSCPSKDKGGSLGTFGPGEMVPEFDQVAFGEPMGVIHGPVETQFGSHLILVTDRK